MKTLLVLVLGSINTRNTRSVVTFSIVSSGDIGSPFASQSTRKLGTLRAPAEIVVQQHFWLTMKLERGGNYAYRSIPLDSNKIMIFILSL